MPILATTAAARSFNPPAHAWHVMQHEGFTIYSTADFREIFRGATAAETELLRAIIEAITSRHVHGTVIWSLDGWTNRLTAREWPRWRLIEASTFPVKTLRPDRRRIRLAARISGATATLGIPGDPDPNMHDEHGYDIGEWHALAEEI